MSWCAQHWCLAEGAESLVVLRGVKVWRQLSSNGPPVRTVFRVAHWDDGLPFVHLLCTAAFRVVFPCKDYNKD